MLKLLLSHWQNHREPLPFVLTDDPLYCSHLTKSPFPEVYSVNRINPIFEEDEEKASNVSTPPLHAKRLPGDGRTEDDPFKTYPSNRKFLKPKEVSGSSNFILKRPLRKYSSNEADYFSTSENFKYYSNGSIFRNDPNFQLSLKRSSSEESREQETKSSVDTGYSSSNQFKSLTTLASDGSEEIQLMSSDSDDCSRPEAVIVSADVHRVSTPDDILVRSHSSESSANYSFRSYGSSPEPFDSLTMSSMTDTSVKDTEVKRPNSAVREKLQKLLEKGNSGVDDKKSVANKEEVEIQKTKNDLMKSLTRALNSKVPKRSVSDDQVVTRSDDTNSKPLSMDRKSNSSSTTPKTLAANSDSSGITRQDESNSSSLSSFAKSRKQLRSNNKQHSEKESSKTSNDTSDSHQSHKCKVCENAHRPLAFHQLLPGHWSYDNVYLPQMHGLMCPCMHHHHGLSVPPSSDDDVFYPLFYHHDLGRVRHSWAPYSNIHGLKTDSKGISTSSKENTSSGTRYSPDGETDSSNTDSSQLKKAFSERRSLREPKRCKCDHCLDAATDKSCPHHDCYCLAHRRVKFASDSDISQHRHLQSFKLKSALLNADKIDPALVMSLPHLNGHVANKGSSKENGKLKSPSLIPRGLKEPIKMDELYRTYPINFRDWEAHYRRNFLQKRKKRALTMVGMAIGIILVVGIAVALTFVFLRIRRPVS